MAHPPSEVTKYFAAIPLFRGVSKKELRSLASAADEVTVRAGKQMVRQGETGRHLYVLLSGTANVRKGNRQVDTLKEGDFFGELGLLSGRPRTATVTAETDLTVMVLSPREFDALIDREPTIARAILREMAHRLEEPSRSS